MADRMMASELLKLYAAGRRNFLNADLSGVDLRRANLQEVDLQGAYLRWADLQGVDLSDANLAWADLQRVNLADATLHKTNLKEANLRAANLQWADLQEADLQGAILIKTDLVCANLRGASLRLANLQGANLDKAKLPGANLRVTTLEEAKLLDADLQNAKLQGANLSKANLTGANLERANLQGADLHDAKLIGTNLEEANLQQANLQGTDLHDARLFGANLEGANLQGARLPSLQNLQGASLGGANLEGIRLPDKENLHAVMLPNGLIPDNRAASRILPTAIQEELIDEVKLTGAIGNELIAEEAPDDSGSLGLLERESEETPQTIESPNVQYTSAVEVEQLGATQKRVNAEGYFTSKSIAEARDRIATAIAQRRGSSLFRQSLLVAYNGRCAISGCDAEPALEAAYLIPLRTSDTDDPSKGLLLRADIHTLFDLYLITVDPQTMTVLVAPSLRSTSYGEVHKKPLRLPIDNEFLPSIEALQWRGNRCDWLKNSL